MMTTKMECSVKRRSLGPYYAGDTSQPGCADNFCVVVSLGCCSQLMNGGLSLDSSSSFLPPYWTRAESRTGSSNLIWIYNCRKLSWVTAELVPSERCYVRNCLRRHYWCFYLVLIIPIWHRFLMALGLYKQFPGPAQREKRGKEEEGPHHLDPSQTMTGFVLITVLNMLIYKY